MRVVIYKDLKTKKLSGYKIDVIPYQTLKGTQDELESLLNNGRVYSIAQSSKGFKSYYITSK